MRRLGCFLTVRAWILSSRAENESLGGGLFRAFFAVMRLGEDLGPYRLGNAVTGAGRLPSYRFLFFLDAFSGLLQLAKAHSKAFQRSFGPRGDPFQRLALAQADSQQAVQRRRLL